MLLTRPTNLADLVKDGKAVYQPDPKNQRQIWWKAAGEVLRTPESDECDLHSDRGVAGGVTPAILSTEISRKLLEQLEDTHPGRLPTRTAPSRALSTSAPATRVALSFALC